MSGAHYIVGHSRSRSPSPVPSSVRSRRSSQRGSVASEYEDSELSLSVRAFGADGRPRRGSSLRSVELDNNKGFADQEKPLPSREHLLTPSPDGEGSEYEKIQPGFQTVDDSQLSDVCIRVPVPLKPGQQPTDSEADSGKPSSPEEAISTTPSENSKKFLRLESHGFLPVSKMRWSPELEDVSVDVIPPVKSRSNTPKSTGSSGPGVKEMAVLSECPSETESPSTSKEEMKQLASGQKRTYGSFQAEVNNVGNINDGGERSSSPGSVLNSSSDQTTTNQEQDDRSLPEDQPKASYYTPAMVDQLRKRNRLYFMDPITKLLYFHGFPWKLTLQIAKVVIITVQIVIFGSQRQSIVEFFEKSNLAFKHLLLHDWDPSYETMPYPPATGQYAIYNLHDLYKHMDYAMSHYHKLPAQSLAAMKLNRDSKYLPYPVELCYTANDVLIFPNHTYVIQAGVVHNCTFVYPDHGTIGNFTYDIEKFISENNLSIVFNRTLEVVLKMYVQTYHLNLLETQSGPTCYNNSIKIVYNNDQRSGQVLINLESIPSEIPCHTQTLSDEAAAESKEVRVHYIALDSVVMSICCLSTILCARSLKRSNKLRHDTAHYFKNQRNEPLSFGDQMEYINMWYVIIICNDALTICGSAFKIQLESRVFNISTANYELCSILLGVGVLLTYVGILRYLGFFKSYNVLILTLKTSFPHVLRFLVCAICLYTGFLFCGWTIFSPFNLKFRSLSSTSECLFSLVNGDDMFVSFSALSQSNEAIWYVNRAYLYIFISLFIYVVISVFIAVIMDNYESLKNYYAGYRPNTVIGVFMKEDGEMPLTEVFSHVRRNSRSCQSWFFCIFPCLACFSRHFSTTDGDTQTYAEVQARGEVERQTRLNSDDLIQDIF